MNVNKNILYLLLFLLIIHLPYTGAYADSVDTHIRHADTSLISQLKPGDIYIVFSKQLLLFDSINVPYLRDTLHTGDTLTILNVLPGNWIRIKSSTGDSGYIKETRLVRKAFTAGSSKAMFGFKYWISQLFAMNKIANWLVMIVFGVIIFLTIRFRERLNLWFSQFGPEKETEAFGSKAEGTIENRRNILNNIFPVTRPCWWMIAPGVVFGIMLLLGSIWSRNVIQGYFSQRLPLLPIGFNHPLQWILWACTLLIALLIIALVLESFTLAGKWGGLLRILLLLLLNAMAILVFVYLSVAVAIVIGGLILIMVLGAMLLGRRR